MNAPGFLRRCVCLSLFALFLSGLPISVFAAEATGHFEVYCDAVLAILAKIDGAPNRGKLLLFWGEPFPPGTSGGSYLGQETWSEVSVYRNGCLPSDKCRSIAHGKVWVDAWRMPKRGYGPPRSLSGKFNIDLNGKPIEGHFVAHLRNRKHLTITCE